jgi:hypothetical protein
MRFQLFGYHVSFKPYWHSFGYLDEGGIAALWYGPVVIEWETPIDKPDDDNVCPCERYGELGEFCPICKHYTY